MDLSGTHIKVDMVENEMLPDAREALGDGAGRKEGWFLVNSGVGHVNGRSVKIVGNGTQIGYAHSG